MRGNRTTVENLVRQSPQLRGCTVEKLLGKGGMGVTYLLHNAAGSELVLKMIRDEYVLSREARVLFVREMKLTRELSHPNIVQLFDSGEYENILFYTMEYCAGGSAHDLAEEPEGKLTQGRAVAIIMDVLTGLACAHDAAVTEDLPDGRRVAGRGIVHRDLKPENILLMPSGPAKVADLGLAKAFQFAGLSGITSPDETGGSIAFQPRQQVKSYLYAKPDVDVWAAAASLYYLLTGAYTRDFVGDTWTAAAVTVVNTSPIPIRQRNPDIPAALADVIDSALDDTGETLPYRTAKDLQDALRAVAPVC